MEANNTALEIEHSSGEISEEEYLGGRWPEDSLAPHSSQRVRPQVEGLGIQWPARVRVGVGGLGGPDRSGLM